MLRKLTFLLCVLLALTAGAAFAQTVPPPTATVYLWPAGSPTLQGPNEKEVLLPDGVKPGQRIASIKNVHNPLIEVRLPAPEKATGCAIVVAPGGGHSQLVWGTEGTDIAQWLNDLGIAVFILKYRLAFTPGYHYTVEGEALQDTERAIRIVRARAKEWRVDPNRVGILGFSAGGALAALVEMRFDRGKADAADPIDRQSCRPDFVGMVYAGWGPMEIAIPKDAAPCFLTSAGSDDQFHARETVQFFDALFKAGIPTDLHIYAHGGHGGGIKPRDGIPFGTWHVRFIEWLTDLKMLKPTPAAVGTAVSK